MRIGIDFDNTIVNTSVTSKRYLDKHLPGNNLNSYHDLSKNEGLDFFNKYYKDITNSLDLFDARCWTSWRITMKKSSTLTFPRQGYSSRRTRIYWRH